LLSSLLIEELSGLDDLPENLETCGYIELSSFDFVGIFLDSHSMVYVIKAK